MSELEFQHYPIDVAAIPTTWAVASISDLGASVQSGFPTGQHNKNGLGIPHIRPMNISRNGMIDLTEVKYVSPDQSDLRLQPGDVLFNNTNSPELIGKTAAIIISENWAFSNHMTRLRFGEGVDHRYAAYYLHFLWMTRYFRHRCVNHVNQASISGTPLAQSVPFLLAPPNEQRRIVAKIEELFSDLDSGVSALERAKANLKRYRAAVLKAAVEGKLTTEWRAKHPKTEPASKLLECILVERRQKWEADQLAKFAAAGIEPPKNWKAKYAEPMPPDMTGLPELPAGWCWSSLDALLKEPLRNGHSARASGDGSGVPTLTLTAITYGDFSVKNIKYTTADPAQVEKLWIEPGDIFIERSNTPELVGTSRLFRGPSRLAIFPDLLIRIRLSDLLDVQYCGMFLESHLARRYFQANAKGLAGSMPKIDQSTIMRCAVALPPRNEQERIGIEVSERLSQIDAAKIQIEHGLVRAAHLRKSTLKRAFEGKLVSQNPNDESGKVLLERLRQNTQIKVAVAARPNGKPSRKGIASKAK